jgi:hypothetical protein
MNTDSKFGINASPGKNSSPVMVPAPGPVSAFSVGSRVLCLVSGGRVWCQGGHATLGAFGNGFATPNSPNLVAVRGFAEN